MLVLASTVGIGVAVEGIGDAVLVLTVGQIVVISDDHGLGWPCDVDNRADPDVEGGVAARRPSSKEAAAAITA